MSGGKCLVVGCGNTYEKTHKLNSHITYHSFPKNKEIRSLWIKFCGLVPNEDGQICSDHFEEKYLIKDGKSKKNTLKPDAIPTLLGEIKNIKFKILTHQKCIKLQPIDKDLLESELKKAGTNLCLKNVTNCIEKSNAESRAEDSRGSSAYRKNRCQSDSGKLSFSHFDQPSTSKEHLTGNENSNDFSPTGENESEQDPLFISTSFEPKRIIKSYSQGKYSAISNQDKSFGTFIDTEMSKLSEQQAAAVKIKIIKLIYETVMATNKNTESEVENDAEFEFDDNDEDSDIVDVDQNRRSRITPLSKKRRLDKENDKNNANSEISDGDTDMLEENSSRKKRMKKRNLVSLVNKILKESNSAISKDKMTTFGEYVNCELQTLNRKAQAMVKLKISQILHEAITEKYKSVSNKHIDPSPALNHQDMKAEYIETEEV